MIIVLLNSYIALLALFVWLRFIPLNTFWKLSPILVLLVLLVGLFIPMGWGAPSGPAAVIRTPIIRSLSAGDGSPISDVSGSAARPRRRRDLIALSTAGVRSPMLSGGGRRRPSSRCEAVERRTS